MLLSSVFSEVVTLLYVYLFLFALRSFLCLSALACLNFIVSACLIKLTSKFFLMLSVLTTFLALFKPPTFLIGSCVCVVFNINMFLCVCLLSTNLRRMFISCKLFLKKFQNIFIAFS